MSDNCWTDGAKSVGGAMRDSDVRTVRLPDGQRIEVDEAPAQRCRTCGRLKHFVRDGRCADCWCEGGHDASER